MPRVLIVTYPWLPAFNVGVKHVATLCRYLPEAGWDPIILTKDWSEGGAPEDSAWGLTADGESESAPLRAAASLPVVTTAYGPRENRGTRWRERLHARASTSRWSAPALARRLLDVTYPLYGAYPDEQRGWADRAVEAGVAAVRQYGIGAIVSFCPPASAHIAAGEIARRVGVPWIPVFGDLFSFYVGVGDGRSPRLRMEQRLLARRWLRGAARAAAVSPAMMEYLRTTYQLDGETIVVPFDPEERRLAPHRVPGAPLRLVHTGWIYPDDQRPELLFDALDLLARHTPDLASRLQVELIGSLCEPALRLMLIGRPAAALVTITDRVPAAEAIRLQREADVLLVFNRTNTMAQAHGTLSYPSKLFEHLNARRPTIAVAADPGGYVPHLLAETRGGETADDAPQLAALLGRYLEELSAQGDVRFDGDEAAIARYAAPEQARKLAGLLDVASAERFGSWQRR